MIPTDIAASVPGTPARTPGATDKQSDTRFDEGFRKLLGKLSGQRHPAKDAPLDEERERPGTKRPMAAVHTKKTGKDANPVAHKPRDGEMDEDNTDLPATLPGDPLIEASAERTDAQPQSLPDLLQALPQKAAARASAVNSVAPVGTSHKQGVAAPHPNAAQDTANTEPGRDPFAALTSLLAREDYGSEPKLVEALDAPIETPKITVVSRETHFEPIIRAAPAQQVADAVLSQIVELEDSTRSSAPADLDQLSLRTKSDGPLKILHLKLEPDNLGEVSIKMRLVGGALELHLEASRTETVEMLMKDKDLLNRLLRTSGYTPDVVTIQASSDSSSSSNQQTGGQQQSSTAQNGAQPDSRRNSEQNAAPHNSQSQETQSDEAAPASDGNLYL
jgi:hypothetical protein